LRHAILVERPPVSRTQAGIDGVDDHDPRCAQCRKGLIQQRHIGDQTKWPLSELINNAFDDVDPVEISSSGFLNDELRQNLSAGTALITVGVAALGADAVARIVKTIAVFDEFCHANDPYEEHDFGSFEADGHVIFFKIEYYDKSLTYHSPDAADRFVTERVITIMLAEEY
jgi:Protein of unknown function (DUF3768)